MHNRRFSPSGIAMLLAVATCLAAGDALLAMLTNDYMVRLAADEGHISDHLLDTFVIFALVAAIFGGHADSKFNKASSTIRRQDKESFLDFAGARTGITIRVCLILSGAGVIVFSHLQYYTDQVALIVSHFVICLIVATVTLSLHDLDDPTTGVVYLDHIPPQWLEELHQYHCEYDKWLSQRPANPVAE